MLKSMTLLLALKDLRLLGRYILAYWLIGALGVLVGVATEGLLAANIAFTIVVAAMVLGGFHALTITVTQEKMEKTQIFIMSLPATIKEITLAKLLSNCLVFGSLWLVLSGFILWVTFGGALNNILPLGSLPFMCIILLGIFLGYTIVLAVHMSAESPQLPIASMVAVGPSTAAYLWFLVYLDPIGNFVFGNAPVWNSTIWTILASQFVSIILLLVVTVMMRFRQRDFI